MGVVMRNIVYEKQNGSKKKLGTFRLLILLHAINYEQITKDIVEWY